jgi:hypothetical protein
MHPKGKKLTLLAGVAVVVVIGIAGWVYRGYIRFWVR